MTLGKQPLPEDQRRMLIQDVEAILDVLRLKNNISTTDLNPDRHIWAYKLWAKYLLFSIVIETVRDFNTFFEWIQSLA